MENRQYLKMLLKGQQPQQSKSRTFFVLDGKVYLHDVSEINRDEDFNLAVITSKSDLAAWVDFSSDVEIIRGYNNISKSDLAAWERFLKNKIGNIKML